ncbi:MAG: tRNA (adenine-N1)-methyltransferase [Candidatus Hodarchaeales archaeon]|jgi:tRNA (adenine57-N1/adenine58-N1)-methyltransferase
MQKLIQQGDWALFRDSKGKEWLRNIEQGKTFQNHNGRLPYEDIIGKPYGIIYPLTGPRKGSILVMEPRPAQYTKNTTHSTNIIYEGDAVAMIFTSGAGPGDTVLEIGSGSGSLTYYLSMYITRNNSLGKIVSIDLREEHSRTAQKNLERMKLSEYVEFRVGPVEENLSELQMFDAAFIDIPTPWEVLPQVKKSLKFGKSILIFLPNWYQVEQTIQAAKELKLYILDVFETMKRPMVVKPEKHVMRSAFRGIIYSGIIIHLLVTFKEERIDVDT